MEFFQQSGAALLICDAGFSILQANRAAHRLFGSDELVGCRLQRFLSSVTSGSGFVQRGDGHSPAVAIQVTAGDDGKLFVTVVESSSSGLLEENKRISALVDNLVEVSIADMARRKALEQRSDRLLRNCLPPEMIPRIQGRLDSLGEDPIADYFAEGSVLFSDIVGFTTLASSMSAVEVVRMLNRQFNLFDSIAEQFGCTKIKTIGDAYMACAGVPTPCDDHAERLVQMGMAMLRGVEQLNAQRRQELQQESDSSEESDSEAAGPEVQVRIGVSSGPLVAGIVGTSRFLYDLWGDTVNTASRMESSGVPGCVQVSEATVDACADTDLVFIPRGEVKIKGKGAMPVYLVEM